MESIYGDNVFNFDKQRGIRCIQVCSIKLVINLSYTDKDWKTCMFDAFSVFCRFTYTSKLHVKLLLLQSSMHQLILRWRITFYLTSHIHSKFNTFRQFCWHVYYLNHIQATYHPILPYRLSGWILLGFPVFALNWTPYGWNKQAKRFYING